MHRVPAEAVKNINGATVDSCQFSVKSGWNNLKVFAKPDTSFNRQLTTDD